MVGVQNFVKIAVLYVNLPWVYPNNGTLNGKVK